MENHLDIFRRYGLNLTQVGSGPEHVTTCPFCDSVGRKKQKFYINGDTGQYHCKRCGVGGNTVTFSRIFNEISEIRSGCDQQFKRSRQELVELMHFNWYLMDDKSKRRKSWRSSILEQLNIGWDPVRRCLVFPIYDVHDAVTNVIHHKQSMLKGRHHSLYPLNLIDLYHSEYIIICEGMVDAITLLSNDFQVATSTGGASAIPHDISSLLRFQNIFIGMDYDDSGESATERWISHLTKENKK